MVSTVVIWGVFLTAVFNLKPVSTATFQTIKIPLFLSPLKNIPRPDETDTEINKVGNVELYCKATIYDDWYFSVYNLERILSDRIRTVIFDVGVLRDREFLYISNLTVYNCTRWCHYLSITDVTRVTGKSMEMLKGNPTPITVLEMHNAIVATMEDIYCFNMVELETKFGMKSTNVTEKEWALFVPEIIKAAIKCRADRLGVNTSELAELLRGDLNTFYNYRLDDLTNTFFPNYANLEMRKNEFETKSFDQVIVSKSWTSARGQEETMLYFADAVANFNIRDLEILYDWSKPQLFAIENIPLSSYLGECSIATSLSLFGMSQLLFGYGSTVPSCKVAYALSRSLNEIESRFNNTLTTTENRNVLQIFIHAADITSWFQMDSILQLDVDEGIWVEIPNVAHVASASGKSTAFTKTCSIPQVIASIKSLNQSGTLLPFLAINNPSFRNLLLTTYGYSYSELINLTGQLLSQVQSLQVTELHALMLNEVIKRYNFTNLAAIVGITGVDNFVLSTLPSFEWSRIVRAAIIGSFTVAADAVSVNIASSNGGLQVVNQPDGNPSVQVSPGNVYFSPRITVDSLATCLLGRNKTDIYSMSFLDYHKLFKENIVPIVNGKITLESQTLLSLLSKDGLTLENIEQRTVAQVVSEQTGLSVQQLGCLYGWNSAFLDLIGGLTWGNVSAFRICDNYQTSTLHVILELLRTSTTKNCFGDVSLSSSTYSVQESIGFVNVFVELVGAVDSILEVKLSVRPLTASVVKDFENLTDVLVTYNIGETGIKLVRVNIPDDAIVENDETFEVFINSLNTQTKVSRSQATITIVDDDFVAVSFQINSNVIEENDGTVPFNAVLTGEIERSISLSWSIRDATTSSSDYVVASGPTITFVPGGTKTQPIFIAITDDLIVEGVEAFTLALSTTDAHVNTTDTLIIINDNDKLKVSFASNAYSTSEDENSVQLDVRAIGVLSTTVSVRLTTFNEDAIAGIDYTAVVTTVSFSPSGSGSQTASVSINIIDDDLIESVETFTATLSKLGSNDPLVTIISPSETTVTIADNDKSTVNFKSSSYNALESQGSVTVNVTLSLVGALQKSVNVSYVSVPGTATIRDFTSTTATIKFNPGESLEKSFAVDIVEDTSVEANEQFEIVLSLTDPQAVIGNQGRTTINIIDNDVALVEFVDTSYSFPENIGNGVLQVRLVNLTGPLQTNVTVSVKVTSSEAALTNDYTNPSPSITFNVGDLNTVKNILLPIKNDSIFEVSEKLFVILGNDLDSKVSIKSPDFVIVTITDDDSATISFSQSTYNVSEDKKAEIQVQVTNGQLGTPVIVSVATSTGTAAVGDFVGSVESVVFLSGETGPKTVEIDLVNDLVVESTETFSVSLSSTSSVNLGPAASINILDNDAITVAFGASNYPVTEGDSTVTLQVVATGQTSIPLSVSVATEDSSAKASSDYNSSTQVVTFNSGNMVKPVSVNIIDNVKIEPVEKFLVKLTSLNSNHVKLGSVQTTEVTIIDNDFATVQFSSDLFTGNETYGYADVSVVLTGALESTVEVRVSTTGGTATAGVDYESLSNYQVTFVPGGPALQYIRINVTDDNLIEGIERFTASLSSPSSFTRIGSVNVTTVRLIDNDVATISFVNAPTDTVVEGLPAVITVEVNGPLTTQVTATATVTAVTASSTDYSVISSTTLNFGPGLQTTSIIVIQTDDDSIIEDDETILLTLTTTSSSVKINDGALTVTIEDNDKARITLSQGSYTGSEDSPNVEIFLNVVGTLETTVSASLSLSPNTALSTDYQSLSNSLVSFTKGGSTSEKRNITIVNDSIVESLEFFTVTVTAVDSNVEINPTNSATIVIQDNDAASIGFSSTSYTVEEDRRANLTVILITGAPLQRPVLFSFSTLNNTAISSDDFAEITARQLQFNIGEGNGATRQITIGINDDEIIENAENFQVRLSVISPDTIRSPSTASVTIIDNDVPSIRLVDSGTSVPESGGEVTVRAILIGSLDRQVLGRLKTSDLTAFANLDYEPLDQVVTFTSQQLLQEVKIKISEDTLIEGSEQFLVTLTSSDASVETPGSLTMTIVDNDVLTIGFALSAVSVPERSNFATVDISLSGTLATPVNFTTNVADVTTTNNADYTYSETVTTINPSHGPTTIIIIPITNDSLVENDESFTVTLTDTSDLVTVNKGLMTITIEDDDKSTVRFVSSQYEVNENELQAAVEIVSSDNLERSVSARVTSSDVTATSGVDYTAIVNQIVTFSAANLIQKIFVPIREDTAVEGTESLSLRLSSGGSNKLVIGSPNVTVILIQDNDVASIQMERSSYTENENVNRVEVMVKLNTPVALQRSLSYRISTKNGTALYPNDFTNLLTVGTFISGATNGATQSFYITILDDDVVEDGEKFNVQLSVIDNALQLSSPNSSTVFIVDNDVFEARFVQGDRSVKEEDLSTTVSVELIGKHERNVLITFVTIPVTATAPQDYTSTSTTLQFNPGESVKSVTIPIIDDTAVEGTENFQVLIATTDPQVNIQSPERITISITDADKALVSFNQTTYNVHEGIGSSQVWAVLRNVLQVNSTVSVVVYSFPSAAKTPSDYTSVPINTITFYGGQSPIIPISFNVVDDNQVENDESFFVFIAANDNVKTVTPFLSTVIIEDNDFAIVGFSQALYTPNEGQAAAVVIQLANTLAVSLTVSIKTSVKTASSADFAGITKEDITFNSGETTKTVSIQTIHDLVIENNEEFTVTLETTSLRVVFSRKETTVRIQDNDVLIATFESPSYVVSEDELVVNVAILVTGSTSFNLSLGVIIENATAKLASDYNGIAGTIQITPGEGRYSIQIPIINDKNIEKNETFTIRLSNLGDTRIILGAISSTTVSILDDDAATIEFTEEIYRTSELSSTVIVTLNMTGILDEPAVVRVSSFDISATAGQDYNAITNQEITFIPGGATTQPISVTINNDTHLEGTESFLLAVSSSNANIRIGKIANTTVRIIDDDVVSVDFVKITDSVNEVDAVIQIQVEISGTRSRAVTVNVTSKDDSAVGGNDYTQVSSLMTFQPSDTIKTVIVFITNDDKVELNEQFELLLTTTDNQVTINDNKMTITIDDNDIAAVRFESLERRVSENDTSLALGVLLFGNLDITVSASVSITPETAVSSDFVLLDGLVTFTPGTSRKEVTVFITDDDIVESTESFLAKLSPGGTKVTLGTPSQTKVFIEDDDVAQVRFEQNSYIVNENDRLANLTAVLVTSNPLQRDVSVRLSTESSSAVSPGDFSNVGSVLIFKTGESNGTKVSVIVTITDDEIVETSEVFNVKLSLLDPGLVPVSPSTAVVTIIDDDKARLRFNPIKYSTSEDKGPVNLLVLLSGAIERTVSARITTIANTAESGKDYVALVSQQITFSPGDPIFKHVPITIKDDVVVEEAETFSAVLSQENGVDIEVAGQTATITIFDNDVATVTLEAATATSVPESTPIVIVYVKASSTRERPISLNVSTFDVTAFASSNDYDEKTELVTIGATQLQSQFIVTIKEDIIVENTEQFGIRMTSLDPQVKITTGTLFISITDNDKLILQIAQSTYNIDENDGVVTVGVTVTGSTVVQISGGELRTLDRTAKSSSDYITKVQSLVFNPGDTSKNVSILIQNDGTIEQAEQFLVRLLSINTNQLSIGAPSTSIVTINDDDALTVSFERPNYIVSEGDDIIKIGVVVNGSTALTTLVVGIVPENISANKTIDYELVTTTLTLTPGESRHEISVKIVNDQLLEKNETFSLLLTNLGDTRIRVAGVNQTSILIIDDDAATIQFSKAQYDVSETSQSVPVVLNIVGTLDDPATVRVSSVNGSAIAGLDYTKITNQEVTFVRGGATIQVLLVTINNDVLLEGTESFSLVVSSSVNNIKIGDIAITTIRIIDNDAVSVEFVKPTESVNEAEVRLQVEVQITGLRSVPVTVQINSNDITANEVDDYAKVNTSVTFQPFDTLPKKINVFITPDTKIESDEKFSLILTSTATGVTIGDNTTVITIVDDDFARVRMESTERRVNETIASFKLGVLLTGDNSISVSAIVQVFPGTAIVGDYFLLNGSVTFTPGIKRQEVTIFIVADSFVEETETFTATLQRVGSKVLVTSPNKTKIYIEDKSNARVRFENSTFNILETSKWANLTAILTTTTQLQRDVSVRFSTEDGTALSGTDFSKVESSLIFEKGDDNGARKEIIIPVNADLIVESSESFKVKLFLSDPGLIPSNPSTATVNILDNDVATIGFTQTSYPLLESNSPARISLLLSGTIERNVSARLVTVDSTAKAGKDYSTIDRVVTFSPGDSPTKIIEITILNDEDVEESESFEARLSAVTGVQIDPNRGVSTISIFDDDSATVTLEIDPSTVLEDANITVVMVKATGVLQKPINLNLITFDVSASSGDYVQKAEVITLDSNNVQRPFNITIKDDNVVENNEVFGVNVTTTDSQVNIPDKTLYITIKDNDKLILQIAQSSYNVSENDESVTVSVTATGSTAVVVSGSSLSTDDGIAKAPADYTSRVENLFFVPGDVSKNVVLTINNDGLTEGLENFLLRLTSTNPNQITLGSQSSAVVIIQDDDVSTVQFLSGQYSVNESVAIVNVRVFLNGTLDQTVQFGITTQDGTATAGLDYNALVNYPVIFPPGTNVLNVPINITDDALVEGTEEFTAVLSSGTTLVQVGSPGTTRISIIDDDVAGIRFALTSLVINEQDGVTLVAVDATGGLKTPVTVKVTVTGKTATSADYDVSPTDITMTFVPNGASRQFFIITPVDDSRVEGDETIIATLSTTDTSAVIITREMQITIKDNDDATVNLAKTNFQVREGEDDFIIVEIELLNAANLDIPVTVSLKTTSVTAETGDYGAVNTQRIFTPGTSNQTVVISITDDNSVEETEMFSATLSSNDNNVLVGSPNVANVTILDDDGASLYFQSPAYNAFENLMNVTLTVVLATNVSLERAVTASFSLRNGTAVSPEDFPSTTAATVTFGIGANNGDTRQVVIHVEDDDIVEPLQTFQVQLVTLENIINPGIVTVNIIDNDDVSVHFSTGDYYFLEDVPNAVVAVTVEYTKPLQKPITVSLITSDNSAKAGEDYVALSSNLVILESDGRNKIFSIPLKDDTVFEDEESFRVFLSSSDPVVKVASPSTANVFIVDNDDAVVRFQQSVYYGREDDRAVQICVLTSTVLKDDIVVRVSTISGIAQAALDFVAIATDITLSSTLPKCLNITLKDDSNIEGNETFSVSLASTNVRVKIPDRIALVRIIDDDVNECKDKTHECDANAFCTDTEDSFNCTCNPGFIGDGRTCIDEDECVLNRHNCHENATCVNDEPGFHCDCKHGYTGDGVNSCDDLIDCNPNPNSYPCHRFSNCLDVAGSYVCFCPAGYVGDGYNFCNDTNECLLGTHNCHVNATCLNNRGSFSCQCRSGFSASGDGKTCLDDDECSNGGNNCHVDAVCTNIPGSFDCSCKSGFTGDGRTCTEDDECLTNPCAANADCHNTRGSYDCTCRIGYSGDGKTCVDNDECKSSPCHVVASCQNTGGSFECTCNSGFTGDGRVNCTDFDECTLNTHDCHINASCSNNPGSFNCTCYNGFSGNGVTCSNINECLTNPCHQNAFCRDTVGSYVCECKTGYMGNGTYCKDKFDCIPTSFDWPCHQKATCQDIPGSFVCSCRTGYTGNGYQCTDINECTLGTHDCHENATCQNEPGTFSCPCKSGFIRVGNDCQDHNECNTTNRCNVSTSVCQNLHGDFKCICKSGFKSQGQICVDVDECDESKHNCHDDAVCTNTFGNFTCACKTGFDGDGVTCLDNNECKATPFPCHQHAECTNTPGTFDCQCKSGFTGDGSTCNDIDECPEACHVNASCTNVPGSFNCQCKNGSSGDGQSCSDLNECDDPTICLNGKCTNFYGGYLCTCNEGWSGTGRECEDIDECKQANICPKNSQCKNLPGLYRCQCNVGYSGNLCTDTNECETVKDCDVSANCTNTDGSYVCLCKSGYSGDGKTCKDDNECLLSSTNTCHSNATCINRPGTYTCTCKNGYSGDGRQCTDIDECKSSSTNNCHDTSANCTNTMGSYTCACKPGFTGNGTQCDDIMFCSGSPCDTNALCFELDDRFSCQCKDGFTGNGTVCTDIKECDTNPCHTNANCTEKIGNFSCQCKTGYSGNGTYCKDIDECTAQSSCHINATCSNIPGTFNCACKSGFSGNGQECQDISECSRNDNPCHVNATCSEQVGSYICQCKSGFTGNGTHCADIPECAGDSNPCHVNATCLEQVGSYICQCKSGFTGNGTHCADVDECRSNIQNCHSNAMCDNVVGSFKCKCNVGYSGNGTSCADVNECEGANDCHTNANCTNTNGSHVCKCKEGYSGDGKSCTDINECDLNTHNCPSNTADCKNVGGSFKCECKVGYSGNSTLCEDVDECQGQNDCDSNADCTNTGGSYDCKCKDGFSGNGKLCIDLNECNETPSVCDSPFICENLYATHRCTCPIPGQLYKYNKCNDVLVFNLEFTILEGEKFTSDLNNPNSEAYLLLKKNLESSVNNAYEKSGISKDFLESHLVSLSKGVNDEIKANFSIFINETVTELPLNRTYFTSQLTESKTGGFKKAILEPKYVLYKVEDSKTFEKYKAADAGDYYECDFEDRNTCNSDEMCQNYPGTHRCFCKSPRQIKLDGVCKDAITLQPNILILNLNYASALGDPNSFEFLQLAQEIVFQLNRYFKAIYGDEFLGTRVVQMSSGSVAVQFLAFWLPTTENITRESVAWQLHHHLNKGLFIGPYQINASAVKVNDYDECNPRPYVHIQDCHENANCTNVESTYHCVCNEGYFGDGANCKVVQFPPKDKNWWIVYAVVFAVAFLFIVMFILIVCGYEYAEENRYQVEDTKLVDDKNRYFFNGESMGIVNQDIELASRNESRMESYKVNPMFDEQKGSLRM